MLTPYRMAPQTTVAAAGVQFFAGGISVRKFEWLCGGTAGSVSVYDSIGKPEGRCVAKLQAIANAADRLACTDMEVFNFTNGIYIVASQVGEFTAYALRNPVGP